MPMPSNPGSFYQSSVHLSPGSYMPQQHSPMMPTPTQNTPGSYFPQMAPGSIPQQPGSIPRRSPNPSYTVPPPPPPGRH